MKLMAAIAITVMIIGVIGLVVWLTEVTDWLIRIALIFIAIVAAVYCSL
jgi:energy-converting hydrogenase Eha subunit C